MSVGDATGERIHKFTDGVSREECALVIPPDGRIYPRPGQPKIGIRHPGCEQLAHISPDLDAFYCSGCRRNGRVSGLWCVDKIRDAQ